MSTQNPFAFTAYSGDLPFVFLSYCHDDLDVVKPIVDAIEAKTHCRVWHDSGIAPSESYRAVIEDRIKKCAIFMCLVGQNYYSAAHDFCKKEFEFACKKKRRLLVIQLDDTEPFDGFEISLGSAETIEAFRSESADLIPLVLEKLGNTPGFAACMDTPVSNVVSYPNGDSYEGNVVDHKRVGIGVYRWSAREDTDEDTPIRYEGTFKDDLADGNGKVYYLSGNVLDGVFSAGRFAQGKKLGADGSVLAAGKFGSNYAFSFYRENSDSEPEKEVPPENKENSSDKTLPKPDETPASTSDAPEQTIVAIGARVSLDENGQYRWGDGYVYEGGCVNGAFSGNGSITFPEEAAVLTATFRDGAPTGAMNIRLKSGDELTLENVGGYELDGQGVYRWKDGTTLTGRFVGALPDDENAVLCFADGSRFEGSFQSGAMCKGTWYDEDGQIVSKGNAGKKTKYGSRNSAEEYAIDEFLTKISAEQFPGTASLPTENEAASKTGFSSNNWSAIEEIYKMASAMDAKERKECVLRLLDLIVRIESGSPSDLLE